MPFNQSRQEPITRPAGSDEGFIVSEVKRYRFHGAAGEYVYANDYDAKCHAADVYFGSWKRTEEERDAAQSELSALREENERLKSESFEELYNAAIDERDALRGEVARSKELTMSMADRANQFEEERDAAQSELAALLSLKESLFTAIAHGDDAHRDWLASAIDAHFSGLEVPEYVASSKDIELAALREELISAQRSLANCKLALDAQTHNYGVTNLRLTAAEQRNAEMTEVLHLLRICSSLSVGLKLTIDIALKPTESGARE